MSSEIEQIYANILSLFLDPKSYERDEQVTRISNQETALKSIVEFSQTNHKSKINSQIVSELKQIFDEIFKDSGIKINYDGFESYLKKIVKREIKTKCKRFVDNTYLCESIKDDETVPIVLIFKALSCKSCGYMEEDHKMCQCYVKLSDYDSSNCDKCGVSKWKHVICNKFSGTTNNCVDCGLDIRKHQTKELKHGILPCASFESAEDSELECKNCIHTETNHMFNTQLFCMNSKAFDNFVDLTFAFQAEFISFYNSPLDLIKYKNLQLSVMNMNYGKQHPMFEHFCNAPIVNLTHEKRNVIKFAMV